MKPATQLQIQSINVCFNNGEHMVMNPDQVMLFSKGGEMIGCAETEEYYEFLRDTLADIKHMESNQTDDTQIKDGGDYFDSGPFLA